MAAVVSTRMLRLAAVSPRVGTSPLIETVTFDSANYVGAIQSGSIVWDHATGAVTSGTGVVMHKGGIFAAKAGVPTLTLDASTGDVSLAGTITAVAGAIGGWTIGATDLSATAGGNKTILSSGATAFSAGPTGAPTVTITQAGILAATGALFSTAASGKRMDINVTTPNEMTFYGDRGDGTVEALASIGINAVGLDSIIGLFGTTNSGNSKVGLYGRSYSAVGVYGQSHAAYGVLGESHSSYGVYGLSDQSYGVRGWSTSGIGGLFESGSNYAAQFTTNATRAAINIVANSAPSVGNPGDLYVDGSYRLEYFDATAFHPVLLQGVAALGQPAFLAYNSAADNNVTGNGTDYTVICDTEIFDQAANYNNATGEFTAPVTGKYRLSTGSHIGGLSGATSIDAQIWTSNHNWFVANLEGSWATSWSVGGSVLADMDAGDVAKVIVTVSGQGAANADVLSGTGTFFSGELAC
jgi:hypothetical protein